MMVSFVPKKNKSVILMSTMHDQPEIDPSTGGINSQVLYFATADKNLCRRRIFLKNLALQLMKEHLLD
ncbi:hypothetical protein quinque_002005 [Culex quinquefasciatus]